MSTRFGSLDLPVPDSDDPVGDPAIGVLLDFAKKVVNAEAATAWTRVGNGKPPVVEGFAHDPSKVAFNDSNLPAIYLFRTGAKEPSRRVADDYVIECDNLTLLWVFPLAPQEPQRKRAPFVNAIAKILGSALVTGRHPAWKATGDTDPYANVGGSWLPRFAGAWKIRPGRWSLAYVSSPKEAERAPNEALMLPIEIDERFVPDLVADGAVVPSKMQTTIEFPAVPLVDNDGVTPIVTSSGDPIVAEDAFVKDVVQSPYP